LDAAAATKGAGPGGSDKLGEECPNPMLSLKQMS